MEGVVSYVRRHHLGLLALFVALSGTAYAASVKAPKNSVLTKSIKKKAVTKAKLAPNSVDGSKVLDGSLTGADLNLASVGKVPSAENASHASDAVHATTADSATNATQATNATHATNSDQLGGAAASAYVKGTDSIPGGQVGGTYAAPTLRGVASGVTGSTTGIFAPDTCDASSGVSGPTVTVTVPASGFVEVLARAAFQTVGGNSLSACIVQDNGSPIPVMSSSSLVPDTRYTVVNSSVGTNNPELAEWIPIFTSPGSHTFELDFGRTGANPGTNQVSNRLLLVRAL